jgi:hypothetical protein
MATDLPQRVAEASQKGGKYCLRGFSGDCYFPPSFLRTADYVSTL